MKKLPVKKIKSKTVYLGKAAALTLDTYRRPDGHIFTRETLHHPVSVIIIPTLPNNKVLLIRQFRHAIGKTIYELPAGTTEKNEPPLKAAKRELAEEAGCSAKRWEKLCHFYPAPGISTEKMIMYRAEDVVPLKKKVSMDEDEVITPAPMTCAQAMRLIKNNQIIDAKTIIGLLMGLKKIRW